MGAEQSLQSFDNLTQDFNGLPLNIANKNIQQNILSKDALFNAFTNNRCNLHKVLAGDNGQGFSYNELSKCLKDIEEQYINHEDYRNTAVVQTLMLGKSGDMQNAQMAIYELPTKELLDGICELCNILKINKIEEIMGGIGLLSYMLAMRGLHVTCTDGHAWAQTVGYKYYNVQKKRLIKYNIDKQTSDDTLYIMAWPYPEKPSDIDVNNFFTKTRPKYLLIINENMVINKKMNTLNEYIKSQDYQSYKLPFKQICYRDYFCDTYKSITKKSYQRSSSVLYMDKKKGDMSNDVDKISKNNFTSDVYDVYPHAQYIQDLIVEGILPHFCLNENIDELKKELHVAIHTQTQMPTYLNTFEEIKFYNLKNKSPKKYPINIVTRRDFEKYYDLITKLETNGVNGLKNSGYLPEWIACHQSKLIAEMYIFTDFSTTKKFWKANYNSFQQEFKRLTAS